jgi:phage gp29-like protein
MKENESVQIITNGSTPVMADPKLGKPMISPSSDSDKVKSPYDYERFGEINDNDFIAGMNERVLEGVAKLEYSIVGNDCSDEEKEICHQVTENFRQKEFFNTMQQAKNTGSEFIDLIWERDQYLLPTSFEVIPQKSVFYNKKRELYVISGDSSDGKKAPEFKVLTPSFKSDTSNPFGKGLYYFSNESYVLMGYISKFRNIYLEKYGTPWLDVAIETIKDNDGKPISAAAQIAILKKINQNLVDMSKTGVLTHTKGTTITPLDLSKANSASVFNEAIDKLESKLMILFLGHDGSARSTAGKLGDDKAALQATEDRIQSMANFIAKNINKLYQWIHDLNFSSGTAPTIRFFEKDDIDVYKNKSEYMSKLYSIGVRFTPQAIKREFDLLDDDFTIIEQETQDSTENNSYLAQNRLFSAKKKHNKETNYQTEINEINEYLTKHSKVRNSIFGSIAPLLQEVKEAEKIKDIDKKRKKIKEIQSNYADLYDKMDNSEFRDILANWSFIANLLGVSEMPTGKDT